MTDVALDLDGVRGGGHTTDVGSFHLSFRSGSRATGACAVSAYDYVAREGRFADPDLDQAIYVESENMPQWAKEDPREYWDAVDLYERVNGRLFVAADFALPRGLDKQSQVDLARTFITELTDRERLPYTFAIHAGEGEDGVEHNPHVHVMISERSSDGLERQPKEWFSRANRQHPERGGAVKSRSFHGREWVERARQRLADAINDRLREHGRPERVDHRSYARQGIDREPGEHIGPDAAHIFERTGESDRLEQAVAVENSSRALADLDDRIEQLERVRATLVLEQQALEHDANRTTDNWRARDSSPER